MSATPGRDATRPVNNFRREAAAGPPVTVTNLTRKKPLDPALGANLHAPHLPFSAAVKGGSVRWIFSRP
jgi:hypothetical protein